MDLYEEIEFRLSRRLLEIFPSLTAGGFLAKNIADIRLAEKTIQQVLSSAQTLLAGEGVTVESLVDDERIAGWREATAKANLKASRYRSSPEQLARRYLRGKGISTPIPCVNLYCAVSFKFLAALGGYDLYRIPHTPVELRLPNPAEDSFAPLGGKSKDMPLTKDIPVYASGSTVMCWNFNHRDSRLTCLTPGTRVGLFLGEAVSSAQAVALRSALTELKEKLAENGSETSPIRIVNREQAETVIAL